MPAWLMPALVAFFCWGIWAFIPKLTTQYINPSNALLFQALGGLAVSLGILLIWGFKPDLNSRGVSYALITGFLGFVGSLAYMYALMRGPLSLVAIVTALYPVLTLLLAYLFLHETVTMTQACGIALGLIAIILMVFG